MAKQLTNTQLNVLKAGFSQFDKNGDGRISTEELGQVLRSLGHQPTDAEVRDMIKRADKGMLHSLQI